MDSQRRFFLLHEACPASEIPKMMCRVVSNKYLPLQNYAPKEPLTPTAPSSSSPNPGPEPAHNTNDIIPSILPAPSKTTTQTDFIRNARDTSVKASLAVLFGIGGNRSHEHSVRLEAGEVSRYTLANPGQYFARLMENELYARDVGEVMTEKGRGYLVTGFLTTRDASWTFESSVSSGVEVGVSLPVAEALGVPGGIIPGVPGLDPEIGTAVSRTRERSRQVRVVEEEIFAVAYSVVKRRSGGWLGGSNSDGGKRGVGASVVSITGVPRVKARHMAFGEGSDDDEEEEEEEDQELEGLVVGGLEIADDDGEMLVGGNGSVVEF